MADIVSNQLARQLTEMVENFTLLDILSKEEQEDLLSKKIDDIKAKNAEIYRRHQASSPSQEVEADKASAAGSSPSGASPTPASPTDSTQTTSPTGPASPVGSCSPTPFADDGGGRHGSGSSGSGSRPSSAGRSRGGARRGRGGGAPPSPVDHQSSHQSSLRTRDDVHEIELTNTGSGLGFGLVEFKGRGVAVKTIVKGGAAAMDGRLETGDLLLSINDIDVQGKSRDDVVNILTECKGHVNLLITREMIQSSSGPQQSYKRDASRGGKRGGPRGGGHPRDNRYDYDQRRELQITVHNELASSKKDSKKDKSKVERKVHKTENITVSVEGNGNAEGDYSGSRGRGGRGRGSRGGRGGGRGRGGRMSADDAKYKEWEDKKQANIDAVEAEIQAMREAYEAEKNAGTSGTDGKSVYSFLDDPRRRDPGHTPEHSHEGGHDGRHDRSDRGHGRSEGGHDRSDRGHVRSDGSRRSQHSWGGQNFDEAVNKISSKPHRGRGGGRYHSGHGPQSKQEMQVTMTGKERKEYEEWKREREKIDQERIARHQAHAGQGGGNWSREWDQEKDDTSWKPQQDTLTSRRADNFRDVRVYGGGDGLPASEGVQPSQPAQRAQPSQPAQGVQPSQPAQGAQPSQPAQGGFRSQPSMEIVRGRGRPRGRGRGMREATRGGRGGGRGGGSEVGQRPPPQRDMGRLHGGEIEITIPGGPPIASHPSPPQMPPSHIPPPHIPPPHIPPTHIPPPHIPPPQMPPTNIPPPHIAPPNIPPLQMPPTNIPPPHIRPPQMPPTHIPPPQIPPTHVPTSQVPPLQLPPMQIPPPQLPPPQMPPPQMPPPTMPPSGGVPPPLAGKFGGCPPEGAIAQPIGVWVPTDQSDVTRPVVESDEEDNKISELRVITSTQDSTAGALSPLSPGGGWTTPTDHEHVVDWAAEANNNPGWGDGPLSPSSEMYAFNPITEAAASASRIWGSANGESEHSKSEKDPAGQS